MAIGHGFRHNLSNNKTIGDNVETVLSVLLYDVKGAPLWGWIAGAAILHVEYLLPRVKRVRANSILESLPNVAYMLLGKRFPKVADFFRSFGTLDHQETLPEKPKKTKKKSR